MDRTDEEIVELLAQNARRTMGDIAERVALSTSAVKRRIDRLEALGVILGYTVAVDHVKLGRPIQAFTELRFAGGANIEEIRAAAARLSEVEAVFTTAGDPDALVWLRVPDVQRLGRVIEELRQGGQVTGTKTLIVLSTSTRNPAVSPTLAEPLAEPERSGA